MASILQKPESQTGGPVAAVLRRSCDPSVCCPQISLREVIAFEQPRQAARLGDGIGRIVAKVEPGGMAALAIPQEGVSSLLRQLCILCHDLYRDPRDQRVVPARTRHRQHATSQHHAGLEQADRRHQVWR